MTGDKVAGLLAAALLAASLYVSRRDDSDKSGTENPVSPTDKPEPVEDHGS